MGQFDDRLRDLIGRSEPESSRCVAVLSAALAQSVAAETAIVGLERLAQVVAQPARLWRQLANSPRAVEILVKVMVGSPYLTNILFREPEHLTQLTNPSIVGDLRSRQDFFADAMARMAIVQTPDDRWSALRRFQQSELLRIGVCDFLGLLDLRSVTNQLSLLADAVVQAALALLVGGIPDGEDSLRGLSVIALGKLGGEELNYSSDIDLVFVSADENCDYADIVRQLSGSLSAVTASGLLYRVDLRLRPWGNAGPLVMSDRAYLDYLRNEAQLWERQVLLKARVIAGDFGLGQRFLASCHAVVFHVPREEVRRSVWKAKQRIEQQLQRFGKAAGEVKLGAGTIRDVEFIVQCLQLQFGGDVPTVRSINTLDGLVRLADFGFLQGDEFRELSSAYVFFRVVEHALQLKHYRQLHSLPDDPVELETLARRLDFLDAAQLTSHFQQHRVAVRRLFEKYVGQEEPIGREGRTSGATRVLGRTGIDTAEGGSEEGQRADDEGRLWRWIESVSETDPLLIDWRAQDERVGEITIAGFDQLGDLSLMCGLLLVHGFDILDGRVLTEEREATAGGRLRFANSFVVRRRDDSTVVTASFWQTFRKQLLDYLDDARAGQRREAQARLAKQVSRALPNVSAQRAASSPVAIEFDNDADTQRTVIRIGAEDTSGFLYELANALALSGVDVRQMRIETVGSRVRDTLWVTDESGQKLADPRRQAELRTTIVLIQHFTHLLPQSPDPEAALLHFQELLERELREPDWLDRLASLQRPEVLGALAKLLGVSDLFWEDFLRLQHANLFPVLTDIPGLHRRRTRDELQQDLAEVMGAATHSAERRERLNAFKDREMFRIDMRHLAGDVADFDQFTSELTELAEVVIAAACESELNDLSAKYGCPTTRWCVAGLGKLGGEEMGFASDIELLFLYESDGRTSGTRPIAHREFFEHVVEQFQQAIRSSGGIFRIDLRLRPHGQAGTLAVSLDEFRRYFAPDGAAWPFERQALIKLRPITGDESFGRDVVASRDAMLFDHIRWEAIPVRAMRERQVRQLVQAGTFHAKLSPGALVDIEYLIQLLQLAHGGQSPTLRVARTLTALDELRRLELIPADAHSVLRAAYRMFRQLIDALRLFRGDADNLTIPPADSEEFATLARQLHADPSQLLADIEQQAATVRSWTNRLGWEIVPA